MLDRKTHIQSFLKTFYFPAQPIPLENFLYSCKMAQKLTAYTQHRQLLHYKSINENIYFLHIGCVHYSPVAHQHQFRNRHPFCAERDV